MKRRWSRWLAPMLCIVVTLGACSPPESGGGDDEPTAAPADNPGPGDYDY